MSLLQNGLVAAALQYSGLHLTRLDLWHRLVSDQPISETLCPARKGAEPALPPHQALGPAM